VKRMATLRDEVEEAFARVREATRGVVSAVGPADGSAASLQGHPLEVWREAEAILITCGAVEEEAKPLLHLATRSDVVGRAFASAPKQPQNAPCNGYESLLCILLSLLRSLGRAVEAVARIESNWFSVGMEKLTKLNTAHDKMCLRHAQLRALYAIIHLAGILIRQSDPSQTLFVDVDSKLDPGRWRAAVRMDDFYGKGFGFHYKPEMRNILRVVRIAKESFDKTASANPYVRNISMLGWGWFYSNLTVLNNLGVPIEQARDIGADKGDVGTIQQLRSFMNLMEDPFVANVSVLASADTAIDKPFAIPPPPRTRGSGDPNASSSADLSCQRVFVGVDDPVQARLISYFLRPIDLPTSGSSKRIEVSSLITEQSKKTFLDGAMDGFQQLSSQIDRFLRPGPQTYATGLILHFHGGGFISQSSRSHAVYLREWASCLPDSVILSIDYKLAPEHQYPEALQECFFAYCWAVANSQLLGTTAKRVILTGDSAGANLAVSLAMKVAEAELRKPDGIVLAYPSLMVSTAWSPSRLLSFFDPMLPVSVVQRCLAAYVQNFSYISRHHLFSCPWICVHLREFSRLFAYGSSTRPSRGATLFGSRDQMARNFDCCL